jgi:hypothetical protein
MIRVASHWKAKIHIYNLKKIQKIQTIIAFTSSCRESVNPTYVNPTYGSPRPLGVNKVFEFIKSKIRNIIKMYTKKQNEAIEMCMDSLSASSTTSFM